MAKLLAEEFKWRVGDNGYVAGPMTDEDADAIVEEFAAQGIAARANNAFSEEDGFYVVSRSLPQKLAAHF